MQFVFLYTWRRTPSNPHLLSASRFINLSFPRSSDLVQLSLRSIPVRPVFTCHAVSNDLNTLASEPLQSLKPACALVSIRVSDLNICFCLHYQPSQHHALLFQNKLPGSTRAFNLFGNQHHPQHPLLWDAFANLFHKSSLSRASAASERCPSLWTSSAQHFNPFQPHSLLSLI